MDKGCPTICSVGKINPSNCIPERGRRRICTRRCWGCSSRIWWSYWWYGSITLSHSHLGNGWMKLRPEIGPENWHHRHTSILYSIRQIRGGRGRRSLAVSHSPSQRRRWWCHTTYRGGSSWLAQSVVLCKNKKVSEYWIYTDMRSPSRQPSSSSTQ